MRTDNAYVLCKLKLGPQIVSYRWWQLRFLGGMGWRVRDRGVRHRLIALVSQIFHMKYKIVLVSIGILLIVLAYC